MQRTTDKIRGITRQSTVRDVLRYFWQGMKPYKWFYLLTLVLFMIASVESIVSPIFYKKILDTITTVQDKNAAIPVLIYYIVIILILGVVNWLAYRIATIIYNTIEAKVMASLRQRAFNYMIEHSYTFFANNFTGSLVQRINRFARAFESLTDSIAWSLVPLLVNIIGITIVLFFVKPIISTVIIVLTILFVIFNYFFATWKVKYDIQMAESDSKVTATLSDNVTNHNSVQLFNGQYDESSYVKTVTDDQARISYFTWNIGSIIDAVQAGLLVIAEFVLFYMAIRYWQQGRITVGTFILIQSYFIVLGSRLWDFSRIIRSLYQAFADGKEMADIMIASHEIKDVPAASTLNVTQAQIEFKDVTFSFNQTRDVLKNVSLTIVGGEKVALIGPSGAGKSTFVRLLLRLYEVSGGSIFIDGQDIRHVTQKSLRDNLSLVPQDPILFHRSLKENIRYGKRGASDEEVMAAAKLAHCQEFIKDLPQGYDTFVGERGIKLSGGERQRIAIARAILKNAPILILDEATSSLDSASEHLIQDALENLMKGKTVIVIAHRLSTIRKMDRIIVLEEGKIREEGSHDELLKRPDSLYQKLWNLQAGGFIPAITEEEVENLVQ
jgi:ATP-binding cassette subfamily B protein